MKISIEKSELQRGLGRIQSLVEKRTTMPILSNVLLRAEGQGDAGRLWFIATDLEIGIQGGHRASVEREGGVTVSAKKLYEIVRELPDERVELETQPNSYLGLRCARSRFVLAGTSPEEYPTLPSCAPERMVAVQAALISTMIERTMYATSVDETRYNLNGVLFEVVPDTGKIKMVATDGHRLACAERVVGDGASRLASGVIIPRKGLAELKRLVDEEDADEVELGFEGNGGLVRKGDVTLSMRLIEGEFPNYHQVIPKESPFRLIISREVFTHAVRRVALLSAERSRSIKLSLAEGKLMLSSSNPDLGEAVEELDVDFDGPELAMGFNARYLQDSLLGLQSKEIQLGLRDELSPAEIRPTDDEETLAVVMPMRLG